MIHFFTPKFIQMTEALQYIAKEHLWQGYALEWLDILISKSLNPEETDFSTIQQEDTAKIKVKIAEEKQRLKTFIRNTVFSLGNESKIRLFIKQYHDSLIQLLDKAVENHEKNLEDHPQLENLTSSLVICIEELLCFIENGFYDYLKKGEAVAITYSSTATVAVKKWLAEQGEELKNTLDRKKVEIILLQLKDFVRRAEKDHSVTCGEVAYVKELLHELKHLNRIEREDSIFSPLDFLLISMNFNCKAYRECLIQQLIENNNNCQHTAEKFKSLLLHSKIVNQIPVKPGRVLDAREMELKAVLSTWFKEEILYLKRKDKLLEGNSYGERKWTYAETVNQKNKIMCRLSADQLGIILRATDELGILVARSMSQTFRRIVPHLSTECRKNLSYDSVRSKSYAAERRDKEIATETLTRMIEKIKEY